MNKNNILKIIFALTIVANLLLITDKFIWPKIRNKELNEEFDQKLNEEKASKKNENTEEIEEVQENNYDEYQEISNMEEIERMEAYVGKYIKHIENGEYENAYNLLHDDFKNNYFKTLEEFEKHCKETYPEDMYLSFGNVLRYGYYYFVDVKIGDFEHVGEENARKVNTAFTIVENDILDFKLSFGI